MGVPKGVIQQEQRFGALKGSSSIEHAAFWRALPPCGGLMFSGRWSAVFGFIATELASAGHEHGHSMRHGQQLWRCECVNSCIIDGIMTAKQCRLALSCQEAAGSWCACCECPGQIALSIPLLQACVCGCKALVQAHSSTAPSLGP